MRGLFSKVSCSLSHRVTTSLAWFMGRVPSFGWRARRPAIGMVLVLVLAACGGGAGDSAPAGNGLAPDFSISLYQGSAELGAETVNFSDLRGKPVVLNFWAGLCPPCRAEMPDLQEFYEEFKDQATLIGVDVGQFTGLGNQDAARSLLSELNISYPAGFTTDGTVIRRYKVLSMPTTVFVDASGAIFRTWGGVLNREKLAEITNEMLSQ